MICIYGIKNLINKKLYIGMTISFRQRKYKHLKDLRAGKHHSFYLQNAWNKYGEENFEFIIIDTNVSASNIADKEAYYIKLYNTLDSNCGYNLQNPTGDFNPKRRNEDVKQRISNTLKSKYIPKPAYGGYLNITKTCGAYLRI